jgi:hypothetical protein
VIFSSCGMSPQSRSDSTPPTDSNWARYDLAAQGSLKLLPTFEEQLVGVERGYRDARMLLFGERPRFSTRLHVFRELEVQANALPAIWNSKIGSCLNTGQGSLCSGGSARNSR